MPKKGVKKTPSVSKVHSPRGESGAVSPAALPLLGGDARVLEWGSFWAVILFGIFSFFFLRPFLTHPESIPGWGDMICVWPYKYFWIENLKRGNPPLWNPFSSLGQPYLASCSSGPYAPFNFLFFKYPTGFAFSLSYFFHFVISSFGTYLFIRSIGAGWAGAAMGGLAYAFSGYFMAKFMYGGLNIITGGSWLPVLLYALRCFTLTQRYSYILFASAALAFCALDGTPQITLYACLLAGLFMASSWAAGKINARQMISGGLLLIAAGFSLGLCQIAPTGEFAILSNRWHWTTRDLMRDPFVPENLRFFVDPFFKGTPFQYYGTGGYAEVMMYIGLAPFLLALGGMARLWKRPIVVWLGLLTILCMALAMADTTGFTHFVYQVFAKFVPGFSHNRVPSRIMILATLALASLAGLGLEAWTAYWRRKNLSNPGWRLFLVQIIPLALLAATVLDLYRFDLKHHHGASDARPFFTDLFPQDVLEAVKKDPGYPRVQPNSDYCEYQLLQNVSSVYTGCGSFFISASEKYVNEQFAHPDTPLSDLIRLDYNYRKVGSQPTDRWRKMEGTDFSVWRNTKAFPRAFMVGGYRVDPDYNHVIEDIRDGKFDPHGELVLAAEPSLKPEGEKGWVGEAQITRYDFNDVEIRCENRTPCFLFLSDSYYPGWKASVDGNEAPIYQADGAFRAIPLLKTGVHRVTMSYYPAVIVKSFYYSVFCWGILLAGWLLAMALRLLRLFLSGSRVPAQVALAKGKTPAVSGTAARKPAVKTGRPGKPNSKRKT